MKPVQVWRGSWSALQDASRTLFRVLGLSMISEGLRSLRHPMGKGYTEHTKIAIRQSRKTALLRAAIHIIPLSVALWEVILNWNTYYVGATIRNIAYYQFGAKIHEMTAQASLAAVLFTCVRHELLLGSGLPFGALFSGLHISQVGYLWSMEFWGTICSKQLPIGRRLGIVSIISIVIILAATIGPSSAILLLPRLAYWPAGSTDIWLNATSQDIWPDRTNGSLVSTNCLTWDPMIYDVDCPSSDWEAIQKVLNLKSRSIPESQQDLFGEQVPRNLEVTGRSSLRQLFNMIMYTSSPSNNQAGASSAVLAHIATSQQVAVADALTTTGILWNYAMSSISTKGHGSVLSQLDAVHSIETGYYQPYTSVMCEYDVVRGANDTDLILFPAFSGMNTQLDSIVQSNNSTHPNHLLEFPKLTKSELLNTPGPLNHYRLRWVELPFNGTAIGAVVLNPRSPLNNTQELFMCSIGAGWGLSTMNTSTIAGSAGPVLSQVDAGALNNYFLDHTGPAWSAAISLSEESSLFDEGFSYSPIFPQRPITVTEDWAIYLNPTINPLNTTIFNNLMGLDPGTGSIIHQLPKAELILADMVANGLARIGSISQLQGSPRQITNPDQSIGLDGNYWFAGKGKNVFQVDPAVSRELVRFRVSTFVNGYSYNIDATSIKLAISLLLIYCLVVVIHIIYAGISGISSTCWDSIGEVTALAMNSTPTTALRNTCAGITELSVFKLPVRVLAFRDEEGDGEHLELVFGNLDEKMLESKTIRANRVYGTMPTMMPRGQLA